VAVFKSGNIVSGEYDGYGRVVTEDGMEVDVVDSDGKFAMYHRACWEAAGRPTKFTAPSRGARDQGYFFPDGSEHDFAPPGTPNPEEWLRVRLAERRKLRAFQELAEIEREWYEIFYQQKVAGWE